MSEERVPYNAPSTKELLQISNHLNLYLTPETLLDIPLPEALKGDLEDFDDSKRKEIYLWEYHQLLSDCSERVSKHIGRQLTKKDILFISDKVEAFLISQGYTFKGE